MKAVALLIGLNYSHVLTETILTGCINDVKNVRNFIRNFIPDCEICMLTDEHPDEQDKVTSSAIQIALIDLCFKSWALNLDTVIFHFSGHGRQSDVSRNCHNLDEGIVPVDFAKYGIIGSEMLNAIFTRFNPRTHVLCIFDCCHSGTILELPFLYGLNGPWRKPECVCPPSGWIVCLTAGRDIDITGEVHNKKDTGAFTTYLLHELEKHPYENILEQQRQINNTLDMHGYRQIHMVSSTRDVESESTKSFLYI